MVVKSAKSTNILHRFIGAVIRTCGGQNDMAGLVAFARGPSPSASVPLLQPSFT